jgi:membrane protease YdiL (CAAX protease family)
MDTPSPVPDNPFERLRLRGLLGWMLVFGSPLLLALLFLRTLLPLQLSLVDIVWLWAICLYLIGFAWLLRVRTRVGLQLDRLIGPDRLSWLPQALLCLAPMSVFLNSVAIYYTDAFCRIDPTNCMALVASLPLSTPVYVLGGVIVAPGIEEIFFRGILLHRIAARRGLTRGIIGSSALFAAVHGPSAPGAFLIGLLLALIYIRTASLLLATICHAVYNAVIILRERVGPFDAWSFPLAAHESDLALRAMIIAVLPLALTFWLLWPPSGTPLPYQRNAPEPSTEPRPGGDDAWWKSG